MNLSRLTQGYDELTDLEKKIVEYIMNNPKMIQDSPASNSRNPLCVKTSIINLSKNLDLKDIVSLDIM